MHIKSCKGLVEAWKTLYNIYKMNNLLNILFICYKFFMCTMQEDVKLLDHINKVKALADQRTYLEVFVREWR